jgi:hypothetical protein
LIQLDNELEAVAKKIDGATSPYEQRRKSANHYSSKLDLQGVEDNDQGHFGYSKTLKRARDKYFWPHMSSQT